MREELTEAVVRRCSAKKALPEIPQNQLEKPAPEPLRQQSNRPKACNSIKMETPPPAPPSEPREIPQNTPLTERLRWLLPN